MMTQSVQTAQSAPAVNYVTERASNLHVIAYRYTVEMASYSCDFDGIPDDWKILDVVVSERSIEKVREVIRANPRFNDYGITNYWEETEDPNEAPF